MTSGSRKAEIMYDQILRSAINYSVDWTFLCVTAFSEVSYRRAEAAWQW